MKHTLVLRVPGPAENLGRPLVDRVALCSDLLCAEVLPLLQDCFHLRDDQLAEVLYDLGCWYADVEIGCASSGAAGERGVRG